MLEDLNNQKNLTELQLGRAEKLVLEMENRGIEFADEVCNQPQNEQTTDRDIACDLRLERMHRANPDQGTDKIQKNRNEHADEEARNPARAEHSLDEIH